MNRTNQVIVAGFSLLLVCAGCADKAVRPSGFLGDNRIYSAMAPDSVLEGVKTYKTTPYPLAGYSSYIVPPVTVYLNEKGRERGVSDEDLRELAEDFRAAVIKALGSSYAQSNTPSPDVAILRLAITDADPNISVLNIHPGSLVMGGGLGGASAEVDLVDSTTGNRVAAFMASSKGKRYEYIAGLTKWGHTKAVLEDWAKIIGERVNQARG